MEKRIVWKRDELLDTVKANLRLETEDHDLMIFDRIQSVCDYCNIPPESIPETLEPFIRRKVKGILDYEAVNGSGYRPEVVSIKEGDGNITWAQTDGNTRASIYSLNDSDKKELRRFRRLRGYV